MKYVASATPQPTSMIHTADSRGSRPTAPSAIGSKQIAPATKSALTQDRLADATVDS